MKNFTYLTVLLLILAGCKTSIETETEFVVRISEDHPSYWSVNGETKLLLGGSKDDNLFQIDSLEQHLDAMVEVGANYIRNTMSSRDSGNVYPYVKKDGLFDLDDWNPEYWNRLDRLLKETAKRKIVVQAEIWATYDFYNGERAWRLNPYNPANNINYTAEESGLPEIIDHTAQLKINPFFESVPELSDNTLVLEYQQAFVDRLLEHTFPFEHVLYCMDNETNTDPKWGEYWAEYVSNKADLEAKTIYITEMWDNWDPTNGAIPGAETQDTATHPFLARSNAFNTINHPELYDFVDISNNNAQNGKMHYRTALYVSNYVRNSDVVRPVNNVKIYGGTILHPWTIEWAGTFKDGPERFWRSIFAGHAAARFHRPPYGQGLSETAKANLKSMRMLTDSLDWFNMMPDSTVFIGKKPNEAFCYRAGNDVYAIYMPDSSAVKMDLPEGEFVVRWLDISRSEWHHPGLISDDDVLTCPGEGSWGVIVSK